MSKLRPYHDNRVLEKMYVEKGMSIREIADDLGASTRTIHNYLRKYNIETRPEPKEKPVHFGLAINGYETWSHTTTDKTHHVSVHRLLAVAEFGIDAISGKVIHHNNNIPWANWPDNLELMKQSEHARRHMEHRLGDGDL